MFGLQRISIEIVFVVVVVVLPVSILTAQTSTEHEIRAEYEQLLAAAEDGSAEDKLALFQHVNAYSEVLEEYTSVAITQLSEASDLGNGRASYLLGQMLEHGIALEQSDEGAEIYYALGAQQGDIDSMLWWLRHSAMAIDTATSDEIRENSIGQAERWYASLLADEQLAQEDRARAAFMLAVGRLKASSTDERGWTVLGEAAVAGHADAMSMVRRFYADARSDEYKNERYAAQLVRLLEPVIAQIGTGD